MLWAHSTLEWVRGPASQDIAESTEESGTENAPAPSEEHEGIAPRHRSAAQCRPVALRLLVLVRQSGRRGVLRAHSVSPHRREGHLAKGPAQPKQHKPYPYDINTHCGVKWLQFGGRWWVLDTVSPGVEQVKGKPPSQDSQRLAGYMTLVGPDTADFDAAGMPTLQFVPTDAEPPGCA